VSKFDVLVPVKALAQAKQRLQPALSPLDRADLMLRMAGRVLQAAAGSALTARAFVVTPDAEAARLAATYKAGVLADKAGALNPAVAAAVAERRAAGSTAIAVVLGDLPGLTAEALDAFLASVPEDGAAIIPDQTGSGTSAFAWRRAQPPRFAFGAGSLARHIALAQEDGLSLVVHPPRPPFHDVDDIADLAVIADPDPTSPRA